MWLSKVVLRNKPLSDAYGVTKVEVQYYVRARYIPYASGISIRLTIDINS